MAIPFFGIANLGEILISAKKAMGYFEAFIMCILT